MGVIVMAKRSTIIFLVLIGTFINLLAVHTLANTASSSEFLQSAIVLENTESYKMVRTPENLIEYWATVDGNYKKVAHFQAADMINVKVKVDVAYNLDTHLVEYSYEVISDSSSCDQVCYFGLILKPIEWGYSFESAFENSDWSWTGARYRPSWSCSAPSGIDPGTSLRFTFATPCLPGLAECFALSDQCYELGWIDWESFGEEGESLLPPVWLTGVKGPMIAPVTEEMDSLKLAKRLLEYLPICEEYGWIGANTRLYLGYKLEQIIDFVYIEPKYIRNTVIECWNYIDSASENEMSNEAKVLFRVNLDFIELMHS